jgi:deoxycytidine triphosphate deaminase
MIIHSKNHVTNVDEQSIQPNAIDIRCSELMQIIGTDTSIMISEQGKKQFFPQQVLEAETRYSAAAGMGSDAVKYWTLEPRTSYQFETNHQVEVPEGMAGWLIVRSTLSRNGIIMSGGLYDSGYKGGIGGTIHNLTEGTIYLEQNVRIGQFIMTDSETSHLYDGHYNTNGGRSIS